MKQTLRAALVIAIGSVALAAAGCSPAVQVNSDSSPSQPTPSKYSDNPGVGRLSDLESWGTTAQAAVDRLSFAPKSLAQSEVSGRHIGDYVIEHWGDPGSPVPESERPLFNVFENFEFQQWPTESPSAAKQLVESAGDSPVPGIVQIRVGDSTGYAWNPVRPTPNEIPWDGPQGAQYIEGVSVPYSKVIWSDGDTVCTLVSWKGVDYHALVSIAQHVSDGLK